MNDLDFLKTLRHRHTQTPLKISASEVQRLSAVAEKYLTLYQTGKLVASEMDPDSLLRLALDQVVSVTRAERGFIATVGNSDIKFVAARNMAQTDIEDAQGEVSRTIIHEVVASGETLCLPNAIADGRFGNADSITRLQLLSVLCSPIHRDGQTTAVIYVDSSKIKDLFDEAEGQLVDAFAQQIAIAIKNADRYTNLLNDHQALADDLREKFDFSNIVGTGPRMTELLRLVSQIADTDTTVVIHGETGTGKELIARALHHNSRRSTKRFEAVNCGAIPETLIESELFGHVEGAFTGAVRDKQGKFSLADEGTIFLDEIGEMQPALQVKLLRVIESGEYSPVGSEHTLKCDVRILAATHRDLKRMVKEERFREDLFYRLGGFDLQIPALRERKEDILLLANHFIASHGEKYTRMDRIRLSKSVEHILIEYSYPGNVRELDRIIEHAIVLCKSSQIEVEHLPKYLFEYGQDENAKRQDLTYQQRKQRASESWESGELKRILAGTGGKVRESARVAGMNVKNFSEKLKKFGIEAKAFKA